MLTQAQAVDAWEATTGTGEMIAPEVEALHVVDPIADALRELEHFWTEFFAAFGADAGAEELPMGYRSTWLW